MGTYKTLTEVVDNLMDKGYTIDFDFFEQSSPGLQNKLNLNLSANDFVIDEVCVCWENITHLDKMLVFAISSKKYKLKGILINDIGINTSMTIKELFQKIGVASKTISQRFKRLFST